MLTIIKICLVIHFGGSMLDGRVMADSRCSPSMIGCLCQNLEVITAYEMEPCCSKTLETFLITGSLVRNISVDVVKSNCSKHFVNLLIRDTGLVKFYSPFKGLENVSNINILNNQHLIDFDKFVFEDINPDIKNIVVEFNSFRTISSKTFANLTKLMSLRLSDNKIGYIEDQSFAGLRNLKLLYMNNNLLTLLSSEMFFGLDALVVLRLFNNPLQEPKSGDLFKYLKSLNFLMMSHGSNVELPGIRQLPPGIFFSVKQLKTLNMTSIRLRNLTALTFYGLNELERLDLQGNLLTLIPSGTLQQIPKISSINLSKNQLYCLQSDTFHSLPKLTNLDLSQNELSYISEDVFKDLMRLQTLDIAENNIFVIEKNAFVGLNSLMIIKINVIHGQEKLNVQRDFLSSSLAKLRNTTKIVGLMEYFGVSKGMNQPAEPSNVPKNITNDSEMVSKCPVASLSDKEFMDSSATGSRKYLLIIVGICVVFLLIAFAIIMTYRAWSKRRMGEMAFAVDGDEKVEMLMTKNYAVNGRTENKPTSKSNHTRRSINGGVVPELPRDSSVADSAKQRLSNSQQATKPPLSDDRCHSDDDSALTPLGML